VKGSFPLELLAAALCPFGEAIRRTVGSERVWSGHRVVRVTVEQGKVITHLSGGLRVRSRVAVLATGIREVLHPDLKFWPSQVMLSRQLIEHGPPPAWAKQAIRLVIVGGSHSAYAVANLLRQPKVLAPGSKVTLLHRGPAKLFYNSLGDYAAVDHSPLEAVPDLRRDLCAETGNVFRYSGLRHGARDTFLSIAAGHLPGFYQLQSAQLSTAYDGLNEPADLIVQALGYKSNVLPLVVNGIETPMCGSAGIVELDTDGRLLVPGETRLPLFVIGMNPYPYDDNSLTPTGQYVLRGEQILRALRTEVTCNDPIIAVERNFCVNVADGRVGTQPKSLPEQQTGN
jgi:hypothetical protein